jgi:NADH-quinone oxidoreductase subunit M
MNLLSYITFIPLLFALVILLLPERCRQSFKFLTLGASAVQLVLLGVLLGDYSTTSTNLPSSHEAYQFIEKVNWINFSLGSLGWFNVDYFVGIDGISLSMLALSVVVLFLAVIASWKIEKKVRGYFALFLLLNTSVIGCFVALDSFLFYVFFEFMLLPMFFLIGIWGGKRREYASIKFFLYTLFGSILILIVFLGLYASVIDPLATAELIGLKGQNVLTTVQQQLASGRLAQENIVHTFNMINWADRANYIPDSVFYRLPHETIDLAQWAFIALLIGFGIKLAIVPVHTWLPDAHVEAPTAGSVILAGVLLKVGGYGIIRMGYAVFPEEANNMAWWVALLGMISILYGGYNALAQQNLKKLIAYSSVGHMGFVLLGLASATVEGVNGAVYQMFAHGLIASMLFLLAGVLYDRTANLEIENYRGIAERMPHYTAFVTVAFFASLGLPGFAGFIAEIMVFVGAFMSETVNGLVPRWMVAVSLLGLVLGAAYYLWTLQRIFFGEFWIKTKVIPEEKLTDLTGREYILLLPLTLLILAFGIFPTLLLDYITPAVNGLVDILSRH